MRAAFRRLAPAAPAAVAFDPFRALGLPRSASKDEIKKRYRELAKVHHPDSGTSANPKRMEDVNRAYNLLIKEGAYEQLSKPAPTPSTPYSYPGKGAQYTQPPNRAGRDPLAPQPGNAAEAAAAGLTTPSSSAERFSATRVFDIMRGDANASRVFHRTEGEQPEGVKPESDVPMDLDPMTERVTPDNKFMYQDRTTGNWVVRAVPLTRPNIPRYTTFSDRKDTRINEQLRKLATESERAAERRTRTSGEANRWNHIPWDSKPLIYVGVAIYGLGFYIMYERLMDIPDKLAAKYPLYRNLREYRNKLKLLYQPLQGEVDAAASAAGIIYLAAALQHAESTAPLVQMVESELHARPSNKVFRLANTN